MKYKRMLLKLSGESLAGNRQYGIDTAQPEKYTSEMALVHGLGVKGAAGAGIVKNQNQKSKSGIIKNHGKHGFHYCNLYCLAVAI